MSNAGSFIFKADMGQLHNFWFINIQQASECTILVRLVCVQYLSPVLDMDTLLTLKCTCFLAGI